jgi:hypothetical protein
MIAQRALFRAEPRLLLDDAPEGFMAAEAGPDGASQMAAAAACFKRLYLTGLSAKGIKREITGCGGRRDA